MTTPPPGPGRVDSGYPGPFGPAGPEDRTRPVHAGAAQQSPVPTQYLPPEQQQAWPQPGGYPPPAQYGQQPGGWPQQGGPGGQFPPFQPPPPSGGGNRTGLNGGVVV